VGTELLPWPETWVLSTHLAQNQGFNVRTLFTVNRKNTGGRPLLDYQLTRAHAARRRHGAVPLWVSMRILSGSPPLTGWTPPGTAHAALKNLTYLTTSVVTLTNRKNTRMFKSRITLNVSAIDLASLEAPDGSPLICMRLITHDGHAIDVPMRQEHAAAFGASLHEYAAEPVPSRW
jgi:hypothetical protein